MHLGGYVEYEFNAQDGADKAEIKLLAEHAHGPFRWRGNLIGAREVGGGADNTWAYGYATDAFWTVNDDLALGVEGFGDVGTDSALGELGDHGHYWGPAVQFEAFETSRGELEMRLGYLFGAGEAEADGQFRLIVEWER